MKFLFLRFKFFHYKLLFYIFYLVIQCILDILNKPGMLINNGYVTIKCNCISLKLIMYLVEFYRINLLLCIINIF